MSSNEESSSEVEETKFLEEEIESEISDTDDKPTGRKALIAFYGKSSSSTTSSKEKEQQQPATAKNFKNKQRVMLLCSRGITQRYRHLMKDLESLLPHARKDSKFDAKGNVSLLNELAELNNCNNTMYFEIRKNQDLYLFLAKTPHGPTIKFHVQNVHTMDELKLTGNCLKGSRPILSFDKTFDIEPHYQLMKQMITHVFGTPKGHRKSKPFFDHVFSFSISDGRIWFRNYQITKPADGAKDGSDSSLVEIGPRFTMNPINILAGGFGGPVIYENPSFISPNTVRSLNAKKSAGKYVQRTQDQRDRKLKLETERIPRTEMTEVDEMFRSLQ